MSAAPDTIGSSLVLPYRFGRSYLLFDRIGAGGMAEIYLARGKTRVGVTRLAVVKIVLPALSGDPRFSQMLVDEAKLAAQLSHANIVQTYDLGREEGRLFIAMEYVEGFDLNELLRRCTRAKLPLPAEFAFFVVGETLRALDYAHRRTGADGAPLGIVHRDVSPSNVLISFEGEVKLCDFGIARAMNTTGVDTPSLEGKAAYMAPEHARGEAIDGRADVFSAAVILWELLAGRRMYKPAPGEDALALARRAEIPPLPDRGLPDHPRLAAIVARGLAPDPADRYPTALAMVRELDAYVMDNRLFASPLRLGSFLSDHFGREIVDARRARERAAAAIERGPVLRMDVLSFPPPPPRPPDAPTAPADAPPSSAATDSQLAPPPTAVEPVAPAPNAPALLPPVAPAGGSRFATLVALAGLGIAVVAASVGWLLAQR
jgi:serine/threonine-protein kinase